MRQRFKAWAAGAGVVLAMGAVSPQPVRAQAASTAPAGGGVGVTTGALAEMCAAGGGSDVVSGAAVGYCRGFLIGVGQYHAELTAGRGARPPVFCLPNPSPTIEQAEDSFVTWARANPEFAGEKAVVGLMRWAAATYPCPAAPVAARRR
jgi:hypothetical protein